MFKRFHHHKAKVPRPLNTGLYKTPHEIAQANYRYLRDLSNVLAVKQNIH